MRRYFAYNYIVMDLAKTIFPLVTKQTNPHACFAIINKLIASLINILITHIMTNDISYCKQNHEHFPGFNADSTYNKLQEWQEITFLIYHYIMLEHMWQSLFHRSAAEVKDISDIKTRARC